MKQLKKIIELTAVVTAVLLAVCLCACGGVANSADTGTEKTLAEYKTEYVSMTDLLELGDIESRFAGFEVYDREKIADLKVTAKSRIEAATTKDEITAAYNELCAEIRKFVSVEISEFSKEWIARLDAVMAALPAYEGREDEAAEAYLKIVEKLGNDVVYNAGLVELLELRLYAFTKPEYETENVSDIVRLCGGWVSNTTEGYSVVCNYGDENTLFDVYASCGGLCYGKNVKTYSVCGVKRGESVSIGELNCDYYDKTARYMVIAKQNGKAVGYALIAADLRYENAVTVTKSVAFANVDDAPSDEYFKSLFSNYCEDRLYVHTRKCDAKNYAVMTYDEDDVEISFEVRAKNGTFKLAEKAGADMNEIGEAVGSATLLPGQWISFTPDEDVESASVTVAVKRDGNYYKRITIAYTTTQNGYVSAITVTKNA